MSSNAEPSPKATCRATTKAGARCRKTAVEDGLCIFHNGRLDLVELGRRGGKARGKKGPRAGDKLEEQAHAALEELLTNPKASATARAAAARLVLDKVAASSAHSLELAKRALWAEQQALMQQELPLAREKLERLIESRAQARAEELYEERRRLELEAVKAELELPSDGNSGRTGV
jgi:hypothetical protein